MAMLFGVMFAVGRLGLILLAALMCGVVVELRTIQATSSDLEVTIYTRRTRTGQWQAEVELTHGGSLSDVVVSHLTEEIEGNQPTVHSKTTIAVGNVSIPGLRCPALVSSSVLFTCEGSTPCSGPQLPGARAVMTCKDDHVSHRDDALDITCLAVGSWSKAVRTCKKVPDGYKFFPGLGWYQLYVVGNTFEQAQRVCKFDGGYLGVIDTPGEMEALMSLFNQSRPAIQIDHQTDIFMGVNKHGEDYISPSGRPMSASYNFRWCPGRPPAESPLGNCTIFTTHSLCHWDSSCKRKLRFLCEIPLEAQ